MPKTARVGRKKATVLDLVLSHLRLRPRGAYTGSNNDAFRSPPRSNQRVKAPFRRELGFPPRVGVRLFQGLKSMLKSSLTRPGTVSG